MQCKWGLQGGKQPVIMLSYALHGGAMCVTQHTAAVPGGGGSSGAGPSCQGAGHPEDLRAR